NVVYVDSHDYAPNSNYRFNEDQATWAENLSLMFTFRGIPCLFYGSEVEFQKGKDIDKGAMLPLKDTGRAYFGGYIEGNVNVMDFAEYSDATGNMASTLTYPLARHIQRLNKIRAAVPALRKGQYSTEGCSGNLSFKRRYKDGNVDSYVLVTISGNSTFTNILNGTYVDAVTGDIKNVTNNTLTAECSGKGNMRVYVLNGPGKIGDDGKYLYDDASVDQPWAEWPDETMPDETWTKKPVTGGSETGGSGTREEPETATAPAMQAGEQAIFLYHESWNNATVWIWDSSNNYTGGSWPGEKLQYLGNNMYKWTYTGTDVIPEGASIIFSNNGNEQSPGNNEGGYKYVNGGVYKIGSARDPYEVISAKGPNVTISPRGGKFVGSQEVTITAANATSAWYKVGSGNEVPFTDTATFTIGADMNVGETVTVSWSATDGTDTTTGSAEFTKAESLTTVWHIFFDNSSANWGKVNCYIYGSNECHEITGGWPGSAMTFNGEYYEYVVETSGALDECNVIFSNGSGEQTGNNVKVRNYGVYNYEGDTGITAGIINIPANDANTTTEYFNLQGIRIMKPAIPGIYITKKGNKVIKAYIHK
ncbi:MAG: starch-binding protein, partial [Prevotella sp.]|nr:starch-binding protein [Prevotella sp.]